MHQEISQDDDFAPDSHTTVSVRSMMMAAERRAKRDRDLVLELEEALTLRCRALRVLSAVGGALFATSAGKRLDERECLPFEPCDTDWGDQDSLGNIPRKKVSPCA